MRTLSLILAVAAAVAVPLRAQDVCKDAFVKELNTSRAFTLKVADAMTAADYSYKMTPPQMSFGQQMAHLSEALYYFMSQFKGEKPNPPKPASTSKSDVMAYMKTAFDQTIAEVSALTPAQLSKQYSGGGGSKTGVQILIEMMEHTAHHRASAEMYLRAKGLTPPEYMD